jgi:hypothetical protein
VSETFKGGVYHPTTDRIFLISCKSQDVNNINTPWIYIEAATATVVQFSTLTAFGGRLGYYGGVYSPSEERIYLVPYGSADNANWIYIDCSTLTAVTYMQRRWVLQLGTKTSQWACFLP